MCTPRRLSGLASVVIFVVLAAAPRASADPIVIPLGAFSGSEQVVQFAVAVTQPLPYSEDGATFSSYSGLAASVLSFNNFLFMGGPGTLAVSFSDPVTMAGFNFANSFGAATVGAEVFADPLGLQSLGQVSLGSFAPLQAGFLGFANDAPFLRANISFAVPGNASFTIDDFRFDDTNPIPEPGTITLTLVGLGWLGNRLRRQARTGV
jgi:hypothetical protein